MPRFAAFIVRVITAEGYTRYERAHTFQLKPKGWNLLDTVRVKMVIGEKFYYTFIVEGREYTFGPVTADQEFIEINGVGRGYGPARQYPQVSGPPLSLEMWKP